LSFQARRPGAWLDTRARVAAYSFQPSGASGHNNNFRTAITLSGSSALFLLKFNPNQGPFDERL
jgi:hypothetical protein